ncbi:MAG: hypothetical protein EOO62_14450 [Hymenobacter sp.]|nr:MAG: hypothetical protein EOO62_14450 [Hymenobacter sp.]
MPSTLRNALLISCLLSISLLARAQTVVTSAFDLRPSGSHSPQVVGLGDSKSRVMQVLGAPTKTSRFHSDIDETWWPVLHYGANKLFFSGQRLAIIELNDARLTVGEPGKTGFQVGSQLPKPTAAKPALAFGRFSVEHKPGKARNVSYQAISQGNMETTTGHMLDVSYEILYDQQGRVSHIYLDETYD